MPLFIVAKRQGEIGFREWRESGEGNTMISAFESLVRQYPQRTCFTYVDEAGNEAPYTYREVRMLSAALARHLRAKGVRRGDYVSVDLPNGPLSILLILAAAYGNFILVAVNNRLNDGEKLARMLELERCTGSRVAFRVDRACATSLFDHALAQLGGARSAQAHTARPSFTARSRIAAATPRTSRALGRVSSSQEARRRRDETQQQDALEEVIHFAERSAHVFSRKAKALVMFTSGTTGKPKAVSLTWEQLCRAAQASNAVLNRPGEGMWQAALPLYHVGGFQVVLRSILAGVPFILYRYFDPKRLLLDARRSHVTHLSVVDKMLQDLLAADNDGVLKEYQCVLLGGGAANSQTLSRALAAQVPVFVSYGMTETASQIAHAPISSSFDGGLHLLPGYEVRIIDPDEQGFGRLAVRGPGVFEGYLNAQAAYTVDGFFLTGDTAACAAGRLYIKERTNDMFVSGGENVYPAEIRNKLVCVTGVSDAYVFGAPDAVWGRRPVAFVERAPSTVMASGGQVGLESLGPQQFAAVVQEGLAACLSKIYRPRHLCVMSQFPRTGIGKVDREALETLYEQRIEVVRITLHRVRIPFTEPFKTAKGTLHHRETVIVEVEDHAGRIGLGECVAFSTDWYLPETLEQDVRVISDILAPKVLSEVYLHPSEVSTSFAACAEASAFPLAQGAIEPALWDLYGKIVQKPLWQLLGGSNAHGTKVGSSEHAASVPAGAVIGMGDVQKTLSAVTRCVEAGYGRVKLKVAPGGSVAAVQAVRAAYPHLMITLDANQSFTERDSDELRALDACGVAWIEEPLDLRRLPATGPTDPFTRLAYLQRSMKTPLCLDESIARPQDLARALRHTELRCYALKIAKWGGVQPTLDFIRFARNRGFTVWMGGMYDTGISKRLHAAFETLPGIDTPGDIGSTTRYFECDVTVPPYTAELGLVTLNRVNHPYGLGCELNRPALESVLVDRIVIERDTLRQNG